MVSESPAKETRAAWRATSASRRGSSHGTDGPNQDAVRTALVEHGATEPAWVVAVSDGHGGARYIRSQQGAQFAVEITIDVVVRLLASGKAYDAELLHTASPQIVERWRTAVLAHVTDHPFSVAEAEVAGQSLSGDPFVAYGATLLVAIVSDSGVRLAQIGDGDALVRSHGFAVRPVPGDARLAANATTSLCLDSAPADFRYAELAGSAEVDLVLLASDGYGNSFAAQDWWHTLVGDIAWYVDVHGFDEFSTRLPDWLAESALVGGDDATAAVLIRKLAAPAPALPARTLIDDDGETLLWPDVATVSPSPRRTRTSLVAASVAAVVVAACVVAAALIFTGDTDEEPLVPEPSSTVTESPTAPESSRPPTDRRQRPDRDRVRQPLPDGRR